MKSFFLLLLFANMIYFFWAQTISNEHVAVIKQVPLYESKALEKLVLLTKNGVLEVVVTDQAAAKSARLKVPVQAVEGACYVVGDFATRTAATNLQKSLIELDQNAGVTVSSSTTEYWVVYPSNGDWKASLRQVNILKDKKVTDLWLVPSGPHKGVISLGVFTMKVRANNRIAELKQKQVNAVIVLRKKERYGVNFKINGGMDVIRHFLSIKKPANDESIFKTAC